MPVNSKSVELELAAGARSIDVSGGTMSCASTISHSYSDASTCSTPFSSIAMTRSMWSPGSRPAYVTGDVHGRNGSRSSEQMVRRVGDVRLEGDDRRRARRLATGRRVERRLGRRVARRRGVRTGQEDRVHAEQPPRVRRGGADVALEVDGADVERVRADLGLLEAPLEAAAVHERRSLEPARLVRPEVDLALEGHVGLVGVEREDRRPGARSRPAASGR